MFLRDLCRRSLLRVRWSYAVQWWRVSVFVRCVFVRMFVRWCVDGLRLGLASCVSAAAVGTEDDVQLT